MLSFSKSLLCVFHRLGVIEEEREEDERKLSVAIAAAERMNVLVRQTEKACYQASLFVSLSTSQSKLTIKHLSNLCVFY